MTWATINSGMPPRCRNHLLPTACDTPTAVPASSLVSPLAISRQNKRSTSRRSDGFPGDFIGDLPVNAFIHPAGLPIDTSKIEVLRRPVELTNYTSFRFSERLQDNGILPSMGSVGDSYDNALMENFWSTLKIELVYRTSWRTRDEAENAIFAYIDGWYNTRRIQRELGYLSPNEYETAWHSRQTQPAEPPIAIPAPAGSR
ncbi:IS3 family transposase [Micromonospora sp. CPCC 205546]|uniref:IS3 family transposase n=1 Tax=Micromonospora sp. CPCC 205546 TaxID=3122397 RepID=UPI002FEF5313